MAVEARSEITPRELFEQLVIREEATPILDVRNEDEFAAWRIEGKRPHVSQPVVFPLHRRS